MTSDRPDLIAERRLARLAEAPPPPPRRPPERPELVWLTTAAGERTLAYDPAWERRHAAEIEARHAAERLEWKRRHGCAPAAPHWQEDRDD